MTGHPTLARLLAGVALVIPLLAAIPATALEFPEPSSPLFFQTSGPNAGLNIGDWYTSTGGGNTDHVVLLHVPDAWPAATPVTVAIYDPESRNGTTGLATNDEVRGPGDTTRFTLADPGTGTIATSDFVSSTATHGRWVELATFVPTPGTAYELHTQTGVSASANNERNDDNSWRLSFTSDPDCAVNTVVDDCSGIEDGDETDDADSTAGTGDELAIGFKRTTYQYASTSTVSFWFYVDAAASSTVTLHNFDLDSPNFFDTTRTVRYTKPNGTVVNGIASGRTTWNDPGTVGGSTSRVGDVVAVASGDTGWWRADIRANGNNQFLFEVAGQIPVYVAQPPTPLLTVAIDDLDADIAEGEPHTYTITLDNVSDASAAPGAAIGAVVSVPLPSGVVYAGCTAPAGSTCSEAAGVVSFAFIDPVAAGATPTMSIDLAGGPGMPASVALTATARYADQLGNTARPVSATDTDLTRYPDLTVTIGPDTTANPGDVISLSVAAENLGDHIMPGTTVTVPVPAGVTVDGAGTAPAWSCSDGDAAPTVCSWTVGTMNPSDTASAALAFATPSPAPAGFEAFTANATITGDYAEVVTTNNADTANATIAAVPDPAIDVSPPTAYVPGTPTTWPVLVSNVGDQDATGVVATVTVPAWADASSATGWSCTPDTSPGATCTSTVGSLAAGDSVSLPFTVATDPAATGTVTLAGTVTDDGAGGTDPNLSNNADSADAAAAPNADLAVDVVWTTDPDQVGDPAAFSVDTRNDGPSVARSVVLTITVPSGLTGATPPASCSSVDVTTWSCAIGDMAPGDTFSMTGSGTASTPALTTSASAASPTDPDGASDQATVEANRPPTGPDLHGWATAVSPYSVDLLALVTDPDGDTVTVTSVLPSSGKVSLVGSTFTYTPFTIDSGTVVFTVTIDDGRGGTSDFDVTIDVVPTRTMTGLVFVDKDGNGARASDEPPVGGAGVTITHPGADGVLGTTDDVVLTTVTAADGTWIMPAVPTGTVQVVVAATGYEAVTTQTAGDHVVTALDDQLPTTGADLDLFSIIGLLLLAVGGGVLFSLRRWGPDSPVV